jgi:hypothetical protein
MEMMIYQLPNIPQMDSEGKPPKPCILLIGSGFDWQVKAARYLQQKVSAAAAIVRTDPKIQGVGTIDGHAPQLLLEGIDLVFDWSPLVIVWVDEGPVWLWIEMGRWLELSQLTNLRLIWGVDSAARKGFHHIGHLAHVLEQDGWTVYPTFEDTLTAAAGQLRGERR